MGARTSAQAICALFRASFRASSAQPSADRARASPRTGQVRRRVCAPMRGLIRASGAHFKSPHIWCFGNSKINEIDGIPRSHPPMEMAQMGHFHRWMGKVKKTVSREKLIDRIPVILGQASWASWAHQGPDWPSRAQLGPAGPRLAQIGPDWSRLAQIGPDWSRLVQIGPDWSRCGTSKKIRPGRFRNKKLVNGTQASWASWAQIWPARPLGRGKWRTRVVGRHDGEIREICAWSRRPTPKSDH